MGLPTLGYRPGDLRSVPLVSESEKPGLRMDFMELRRFGCADSETAGRGSISVAEKERFREGERKELGDKEDGRCVGEG